MTGYEAIVEILRRTQPLKIYFMAVLEEDGDVGLDWDESNTVKLSFNVRDDGQVGWSSLIRGDAAYGRFFPPSWPVELDAVLKRASEGL